MYVMDNPDLPTLQPWRPTVGPPAQVFVSERNPYFHRVDERGRQLPYIDRLVMILVERAVIPVKTSTGEADLQARYLSFDQVPFLRKNEQLAGYRVFLWNTGVPSTVAIYPNLTTSEPVMRKLLHDRRFRQALSLGVNREEINHILYYGLGLPGQNTVLRSPAGPRGAPDGLRAVRPARRPTGCSTRWASRRATAADSGSARTGSGLDLIVETSGEETEHTDVLELVKDTWAELGIELLIRPSQLEVFRRRVFSGEAMMSAYNGNFGFGLPTPGHEPGLARAGEPAAAPVAQVGGVLREQGPRRRGARRSRPPGAWSSSTSGGSCRGTPTSGPGSGRRCSTSTPRRSSRSASWGARSSRSS